MNNNPYSGIILKAARLAKTLESGADQKSEAEGDFDKLKAAQLSAVAATLKAQQTGNKGALADLIETICTYGVSEVEDDVTWSETVFETEHASLN